MAAEILSTHTPALFQKYPTAKAFAEAEPLDIEKMVYRAGFFRANPRSIMGACRALVEKCVAMAVENQHSQVVIHTTASMKVAWKMYEALGFKRSEDLDFMQGDLAVFGFRLALGS